MSFISTLLSHLDYPTILLLMLLESTVIPVPSELVVAPAAYHAASGELNIFLVVLFATIGADLGASINYFVALYVGRPVIYKYECQKDIKDVYVDPLVWNVSQGAVYVETDSDIPVKEVKMSEDVKKAVDNINPLSKKEEDKEEK